MAALDTRDIRRLFELLNKALRDEGIEGELFVVGGAVMCLAYAARPSTQEVDAFFRPAREIRTAAARVAVEAGLSPDWLNDGVKGFLGERGKFAPFLELDHLRVMVAQPEYLLAMKCLAMRIGAEFHDEDDVRYLLRHLDMRSYERSSVFPRRRSTHSPTSCRHRLDQSARPVWKRVLLLPGKRKRLVHRHAREREAKSRVYRFSAIAKWAPIAPSISSDVRKLCDGAPGGHWQLIV